MVFGNEILEMSNEVFFSPQGIEFLLAGDVDSAEEFFREAQCIVPEDTPSSLLLSLCRRHTSTGATQPRRKAGPSSRLPASETLGSNEVLSIGGVAETCNKGNKLRWDGIIRLEEVG